MVASPTTAETNAAPLGLLIFDGDCGFCTTSAHWFADRANDSATIAPWQALELSEYGLTEQDCSTAAYWYHDGVAYRGADGAAQALSVCTGKWPLVGRILRVPPFIWLARGLYPVIARYRYKLPGATNACRIPQ